MSTQDKVKHLPWYTNQAKSNGDSSNYYEIHCNDDYVIITTRANAELIVKAVNSHDELLEVCKQAKKDVDEGYPNLAFKRLEQVIAKVEGN